MYTCMWVCMCVYIGVRVRLCVYMGVEVRVEVCIKECMYVHVHMWNMKECRGTLIYDIVSKILFETV